ncbi:hypothetical protein [Paenibacillus baekrokdamisoli]|uniref:hypothetical protein n=1 Tax=Paenibacillus baekrokdamisoli TaxID=1712516 RepID=UPI00161D1393|nr:hypothetical protein [Paenibacillus baekrokdamisoli]
MTKWFVSLFRIVRHNGIAGVHVRIRQFILTRIIQEDVLFVRHFRLPGFWPYLCYLFIKFSIHKNAKEVGSDQGRLLRLDEPSFFRYYE